MSARAARAGEDCGPIAEDAARPRVQPSSRDCFVCGTGNRWGLGVSFYTVGPYQVEARTVLTARHQGHPGWAHGGVLAALLDEAMGRAMMSRFPDRFMVTARLEVSYLAPVPIGTEIRIHGHITSDRRILADAICCAYLGNGALAVKAEGLLARPGPRPAARRVMSP